jgi:hypothetical protein
LRCCAGGRRPAAGVPAQQDPLAPLAAVHDSRRDYFPFLFQLKLIIYYYYYYYYFAPVCSDVSVVWRRIEEDGVFYFVATSIDNPKVGSSSSSLGFIPAKMFALGECCGRTN